MPTVSIARDELFSQLGSTYTQDEFDEICFEFGLELDDVVEEKVSFGSRALSGVSTTTTSNSTDEKQTMYKIEVPANRYDLLCVEGLSQALRVFLQKDKQMPQYTLRDVSADDMIRMKVDVASTSQIRPYIVCAVLRDVQMDEKVYKSLIDLQDKLHHNICRKRTLVAIGTHDLDVLTYNRDNGLSYTAERPTDIRFIPLAEQQEMDGAELMEHYESDTQMKKYLPIIKDSPVYPVVRDSDRSVLSLPPIINGDMSKVTLRTRNILIECTATDVTKANIVLNILVATFSRYCERKYEVEPVQIVYDDSEHPERNSTTVTPDFSQPVVEADVKAVRNGVGVHDISESDMIQYLKRMQLDASVITNQQDLSTKLAVNVPIIRPDILHECDIMCDIAVAYGFNNIPERPITTYTVAKQQRVNTLSDMVRREGFAQQGYTEVLTWVTVSTDENYRMLNRSPHKDLAVKIGNPKTLEFQQCRLSLITGLLKTLKENRKVKIPVRLFEVGDVIVKDSATETGAKNIRKCAAVYCANVAGFEVIQGLLEHCLRILGAHRGGSDDNAWDLDSEGCDDDCFMKGRRASIVYKGKAIGTCGWIHPDVLTNFSLTYPCAAFEFDLQVFV